MSEPIQIQSVADEIDTKRHPSHNEFKARFDASMGEELGGGMVFQLVPKSEGEALELAQTEMVSCGRCEHEFPVGLTFRAGATRVCIADVQDVLDDLVFDIECPPEAWAEFYQSEAVAESANQ